MNEKNNEKKKTKKKIKIKKTPIIILIIILVILIAFFSYLKTGDNTSKYGNRLTNINKHKFDSKKMDAIKNKLKENENVSNPSVRLQGKIIYIAFNVNENITVDDAHNIGNSVLEVIDDDSKGFYDINITITKKDEKGEEVQTTNDSGEQVTKTVKSFPIMGYKKSSSANIVW